jgi:hypothetical protein
MHVYRQQFRSNIETALIFLSLNWLKLLT